MSTYDRRRYRDIYFVDANKRIKSSHPYILEHQGNIFSVRTVRVVTYFVRKA